MHRIGTAWHPPRSTLRNGTSLPFCILIIMSIYLDMATRCCGYCFKDLVLCWLSLMLFYEVYTAYIEILSLILWSISLKHMKYRRDLTDEMFKKRKDVMGMLSQWVNLEEWQRAISLIVIHWRETFQIAVDFQISIFKTNWKSWIYLSENPHPSDNMLLEMILKF